MRAARKILFLYVLIGLGNLIPISAQSSKIDSLKKIVETGVKDTSMVTVLNTLSTETEDFKKSFKYAEQANDLATSLKYKLGKAYALKNMGIVEYYQGNYVAVLDYWLQSLEIFESLQNDLGIANLTNNLGAIYYSQGSSVKAIDYYLRSLSIAEKLNDPFRITSALSNIGAVYGQMGAYDQALDYLNRIEPYLDELNSSQITTAYLMGIGEIYIQKGDIQNAQSYFRKALIYSKNTPDYAHNLAMLGKAEFKRGNPKRAIYYLDSAYATASEKNLQLDKVQTLIALGEIYQNSDFEKAQDTYEEAEALALEMNTHEELRDIFKGMSKTYANHKDYKKAFKYQNLYLAQKDSLFNLAISDKIRSLQFDFDLQKKQDQIGLLEKEAELTELRGKRQRYIIYGSAISLVLLIVIAGGTFSRYRYVKKTSRIIVEEKDRSDKLLLNILPNETARELKLKGKVEAKRFESVSVMFTDFKGFTAHSQNLSPEELVKNVDYYFSRFDRIMEKYNLEKIKTIGDAYMCAGGLPFPTKDHSVRIVQAALEIIAVVEQAKKDKEVMDFEIRIGINTGPVVAGVVGTKKFAYDIWGDTVNVASRMESMSIPGKINISENTYVQIRHEFKCEERGEVFVKNKGKMKMYFINGKQERISGNNVQENKIEI